MMMLLLSILFTASYRSLKMTKVLVIQVTKGTFTKGLLEIFHEGDKASLVLITGKTTNVLEIIMEVRKMACNNATIVRSMGTLRGSANLKRSTKI